MTAALASLRRYRMADLEGDNANRPSLLWVAGKGRIGEAGRHRVLDFWERYIRNEGIKNAAAVDRRFH